ncbi:hypothetical protein BBD42_06535 [Paenibacillus sp. BIHB 4019]|uniref:Metallo-beta-lactamase domain-containing protein n=1 Tax=Paenibacillus sp. BIHB 4019 TaxID=1870819 RepID=A0A1B2DEN0_9BACL|nr:MBL fold metallo-hydrolase [Paenibacillus sp. BIHB 4019]ANY66155.1 hypothetical protein BBD42_06535 [Paenibacillus sp. BIHB 4019]
MQITQIRNATLKINYGGLAFLIDPFLAPKGTYRPFPNTANQEQFNPTVELPFPAEQLLPVDAVIVTHLHVDHFDQAAAELLPKDMVIFAQNEHDAAAIREKGFEQVRIFTPSAQLGEVSLSRTYGRHGTGEIGERMGEVSGIVFQHAQEQTLYVAGDTIWCEETQAAIEKYEPSVIVVNGGAAQFLQGGPILMTKEDIYYAHLAAPQAVIISSHMGAVNHCMLSRPELREYAAGKGLSGVILVPEDGETIIS